MFTLFALELLGAKKITCWGHPSRGCPAGAVHPVIATRSAPSGGHSPGLGIGWLKGPGMEIRRDPRGLKCGPVWPLPSPLSRSNLDPQKSLFFPLGPQLTLRGVWGARSALPAPPCRPPGGERQRGGAGLLPPCPQPSPGETTSPASETGPRADSRMRTLGTCSQLPLCPGGGGLLLWDVWG